MIKEPAITPELVAQHGITPEEYENILKILGREPNYTELGIFSVMWSEHCSYKNTKPLLKQFPTRSEKILVGAGEENAGKGFVSQALELPADAPVLLLERMDWLDNMPVSLTRSYYSEGHRMTGTM